MTQLFGLAIFTKKEVMQLLIDEKRASYRKGYKAGAAMKYRHTPKPEVPVQPLFAQPDFLKPPFIVTSSGDINPATSATWPDHGVPTVYGDSLPVKPNSFQFPESLPSNDTLTSEQSGV